MIAGPVNAGVVYDIDATDYEQTIQKTESIKAAGEGRHLKVGIASGGRGRKAK